MYKKVLKKDQTIVVANLDMIKDYMDSSGEEIKELPEYLEQWLSEYENTD